MGINARKIEEIKTKDKVTFSYGSSSDAIELMEMYVSINDQTNEDACGIFEIDADEFLNFFKNDWQKMKKDRLNEHLKRSIGSYSDYKLGKMSREELTKFIINCDEVYMSIKEDCEESVKNGEYWVQYLCY